MIDIKELRRLAQAAIAKMNASDPEFASSTPPLAILELLDRLEAAEAEALEEARLNGMGAEREAALLAKLEATEEDRSNFLIEMGRLCAKCDALRAKLEAAESDAAHQKALADTALRVANGWERKCDELRIESDTLRAKIEQMERQEPVAEWTENRFHQYPQLVWNKKYRVNIGDKLYTLPGAKGE